VSRINLTIDRLVLKGIDPADRGAFVGALKSELARILGNPQTRAAWSTSRRTPVMRLGRIPMQQGIGGVRNLGTGVARAIGKGIKP